jgi:PPOX class probable F420-dependent enzyme
LPGTDRPPQILMPRLAEDVARRLLASARVARLATCTAEGRPHIVPVTFAVDGDWLYSVVDAKPKTTRDLRRIANIRADGRVAMLADHYDEDWNSLWWVRADGDAAILDDPEQLAGPVSLLAGRYPQYREQPPPGPLIAIAVRRWTGWAASA